MTASLQWVLATVLTVQGATIKLDKGLLEGLRPGDTGFVYYDLAVETSRVRIEIGAAQVVECEQLSCTARVSGEVQARVGFSFRAEVDSQRTSAAELLRLGNSRLEGARYDLARGYFEKLTKLMPADPLAERRLREIDDQLSTDRWRQIELDRLDFYRLAANQSLAEGDFRGAWDYVKKVARILPDDPQMLDLGRTLAKKQVEQRMLVIPAGTYVIGLPSNEASFYNQQPRFPVELPGLMVDRRALRFSDIGKVEESEDPYVSEVDLMKAAGYCASLGLRLLTEFEWEVAASHPEFQPAQGLSEWTTSWYQPYPGNRRVESAYGESFKVVRGLDAEGRFDARTRSFMAPGEAAPDVGLRCARELDGGSH